MTAAAPGTLLVLLVAACSVPSTPSDAGSDVGFDAAAPFDAGVDAAAIEDGGLWFPARDGDIPCGSDTCAAASGSCCPRPDGTWFCCGGASRCDFDAGVCECNGREPCELGFFCCGEWEDGGLGGCVDYPTYELCLSSTM